jgi:hypothetical protein
MATECFGSIRRAAPGEFSGCITLREVLDSRRYRNHADTPTRRHADTPTRRHADTPTRHSALGVATSWVPRLSGLNGVVDG